MSINDNGDIWIAADSLYKSSDYGLSFEPVFSGYNWINKSGLSSFNQYIILADVILGNGLYLSSDNGKTWENLTSINYSLYSVAIKNGGQVLVGTSSVLLYSNDYGNSWLEIDAGETVIEIEQDQCENLFFGTNSKGLYKVDILTGIEEYPIWSESYFLSQNYPNPFNPITKIKYSIPLSENVQIKIYNVLSKEIKTIISEFKQTGDYEIEFDASGLPSGVYFYRIISGGYSETKKMILLR